MKKTPEILRMEKKNEKVKFGAKKTEIKKTEIKKNDINLKKPKSDKTTK